MISFNSNIIGHVTRDLVLVEKKGCCEKNESLSDKDELALKRLKERDREVRMHEGSHMAGSDVIPIGGPRYKYVIGPDGKPYAVGGEVTLTTGPSRNADTAIRKARALGNAALAPGSPSAQDLSAASSARAMEMEAIIEKSKAADNNQLNNELNGDKEINTKIELYKKNILDNDRKSGSSPYNIPGRDKNEMDTFV